MRASAPIYIMLMISSLVAFAARAQEDATALAGTEQAAVVEGCDVFGGIPDVATGMFPCPRAEGLQPLATIAAAPEKESE